MVGLHPKFDGNGLNSPDLSFCENPLPQITILIIHETEKEIQGTIIHCIYTNTLVIIKL